MKDTPCGRWRVEYSRERFMGDTTYDVEIFDKKSSKKLVDLYNYSPFDIFLSPGYDFVFLERWGKKEVVDIATGIFMTCCDGRWYKDPLDRGHEPGVEWPDDWSTIVRLDFFLTGEYFEP
jgi:hypothetical protein